MSNLYVNGAFVASALTIVDLDGINPAAFRDFTSLCTIYFVFLPLIFPFFLLEIIFFPGFWSKFKYRSVAEKQLKIVTKKKF